MSRAIVCLGDSLTAGIFTNGYPTTLQDLLNQRQPGQFVVKKHGIAGATVSDWLSQHLSSPQYKQSIAGGCDAIVLMLGTNDARMGCGFNEQQFCDQMKQLVNRLKNDAPGASIFLATPTPVAGPDASKCYDPQIIHTVFPRIFPQIAASLGATSIDCCSALGGCNANQRLFGDGCHPLQEGDSMVASTVCEHVMRISGKAGSPNPSPPVSGSVTPEASPPYIQFQSGSVTPEASPPYIQFRSGSVTPEASPPSIQFREELQPSNSRIPGGVTAFQMQGSFATMQSLQPSFSMGELAPVQKITEVPQVQCFPKMIEGPQVWQKFKNSAEVGPVRKIAEVPQVQRFQKMVETPQVQKIMLQGVAKHGSGVLQGGVPQGFAQRGPSRSGGVMRARDIYASHMRSGSWGTSPVSATV